MKWGLLSSSIGLMLFATLPQTGTYKLQSYGFGSAGTANNTKTTTYSLNGIAGEVSGQTATSTHNAEPGYTETLQANVPQLLSSDNGSGLYYNKIHFVIDQQGNPTDAKYLITVSTSSTIDGTTHEFSTSPMYLQTDGTLNSTLNLSDYQTYSAFGGSSGSYIIGLVQNTHYYIHLKATQGAFTESAYGPVTDQPTAPATITFSLATSANSTPPFTVGMGTLNAGTITTSGQTINTSFSTNGASGGDVYVKGLNGGLKSASTTYEIATVSNNLSSLSEGFGGQNTSISQSSGGPYTVVSPYNVSGTTVGSITTSASSIYTSSSPVTSGNAVLTLLAKAASTDIAAKDYQEVLTFVAAANF